MKLLRTGSLYDTDRASKSRQRNLAPNKRRPLREILFEGAFGRTIERLK
jgi:hypothetical protein